MQNGQGTPGSPPPTSSSSSRFCCSCTLRMLLQVPHGALAASQQRRTTRWPLLQYSSTCSWQRTCVRQHLARLKGRRR